MTWAIQIYPSAYRNNVAIYNQVRPVASDAPTGLTLHPSETGKTWVDEFGATQSHVASHDYLPAVAGTRHTLTTSVHVATYGTRTYTQTIEWSNRLGGLWTWKTKIEDSVGPTTYELSWLEIDGDNTPANGGLGLPGTGAGVQIVERYTQRWSENDQYADTYKHDNPTQNGAGQSLQQDPDGPFAAYFDPFTNLRVYGPLLLDYKTPTGTGDYFNAGFQFVDFGGDGTAATSSLGHTPHELYETPETPAVWNKLGNQRVHPNWGGLATSAMIQRIDYWTHSYDSHDQTGVQGPNLAGRDTHNGFVPKYFDKAYIVDLAVGASSPLDVDTLTAQQFAYDGSAVFTPTWAVTMREVIVTDKNGDSLGASPLQLSPYKAVVVYNVANDFAMALATKLQDADDDGAFEGSSGHLGSRILGLPNHMTIGQFITSATLGITDEGFSTRLTANCKSEGGRFRGWIGHVEYLCIGRLLDVRDALDELYSSGALDELPIAPPEAVTSRTIPPYDTTTMPTPLRTIGIVLITGNSQMCSAGDDFLRNDANAELCKLPEQDPLRSDRPLRTTDSRLLMWNDDLERVEMLAHNSNASGWGLSRGDRFGFETALGEALRKRDLDEVLFIKCPGASTSLMHDPAAPGCWTADASALTTITASATITPTATGATITAAAGTFSAISAPCYVQVTGSRFIVNTWSTDNYLTTSSWKIPGVFARSGNNTYRYKPMPVTAVSVDGSTVTVGSTTANIPLTWNAETRTFTFTFGPVQLRTALQDTVERCLHTLRYHMRLEPKLLLTVNNAGENDRSRTQAEFRGALLSHVQFMRSLFGVDGSTSQDPPHAEIRMTDKLHGATDDQIAGIRAATAEVVDSIPNAFLVNTDDLPVAFEPGETTDAPWPPVTRQDNGTHYTASANLEIGWRIDDGLERFPWFPARTYAPEVNPSGQCVTDPHPSPTLESLRTLVKRRWERDNSSTNTPDATLNTFINDALREVYAALGDEAYFLRRVENVICNWPPTTTTLPSYMKRVYRFERSTQPVNEVPWVFHMTDPSGNVVVLTREGGTMSVHYHAVPSDLLADGDVSAIPFQHKEVPVLLVCRRLAVSVGNMALVATYSAECDRAVKAMRRDCQRYGRMRREPLSTGWSTVKWTGTGTPTEGFSP